MYFHTDDIDVLNALAAAISRAQQKGTLRILVNDDGSMQYKVGESGTWTLPIGSTFDPYRDSSPAQQPDTDDGLVCPECQGKDGSHYLDCPVWAWN